MSEGGLAPKREERDRTFYKFSYPLTKKNTSQLNL